MVQSMLISSRIKRAEGDDVLLPSRQFRRICEMKRDGAAFGRVLVVTEFVKGSENCDGLSGAHSNNLRDGTARTEEMCGCADVRN